MAAPAAPLCLLLPARRRLAGQALPPDLARALGRADVLPAGEAGERAQLLRHFELLPRGLPAAALTRALDSDDAGLHAWLRADPAHVRPDMTGARVLAIGDLGLTHEECQALIAPLRPLFGDAGFTISAPAPDRWYLALPREARLPAFAPPEEVLGDDLFQHLPDGPDGRRWRALLNEAQVSLHNHPVNLARAAAGKPTANSLCFWGFGLPPDHVRCAHAALLTQDVLMRALAQAAGVPVQEDGATLMDLRALREVGALAEAVAAAGSEGVPLVLDFADGHRLALARSQRWRVWRRPLAALA